MILINDFASVLVKDLDTTVFLLNKLLSCVLCKYVVAVGFWLLTGA